MGEKKKPLGRPRLEFNQELFERMCHIQCTETEIAATLGMSVDTLETRVKETYGRLFSEVFREKREGGKESLRRAQWNTAIKKENPIMQIFLGKNLLGQADKQEIDLNANVSVSMEKALEDMD